MAVRLSVDEDEVMRLVRTGITYTEVSMMLRVPDTRVANIARKNGYDTAARIKLRAQKRAELQARARAQKAFEKARKEAERQRRISEREAERVRRAPPVPEWAKAAGLAEDYRDYALVLGEFVAARHCRQLLAEMRAAA